MHVQLKACARCGGDVFIERDLEGQWLVCLQCGRAAPLPAAAPQPPEQQKSGVA